MTVESLSISQAKAIVEEILERLTSDQEASGRLKEVRTEAGNDMIKYMQLVFPLVVLTQNEVISRHGFTGDRAGVTFTQQLKNLESQDPELAALNARVKEYFLPSLGESKEV